MMNPRLAIGWSCDWDTVLNPPEAPFPLRHESDGSEDEDEYFLPGVVRRIRWACAQGGGGQGPALCGASCYH